MVFLKFNVNGIASGKLELMGTGGVLRDTKGKVLYMFSKDVGIKDSKEAEIFSCLGSSTDLFIVVYREINSGKQIHYCPQLAFKVGMQPLQVPISP